MNAGVSSIGKAAWWMMAATFDRFGWQKVVEMAAPACRVVAGALFHDACPIEDTFDPSTNHRCCLSFLLPDRL